MKLEERELHSTAFSTMPLRFVEPGVANVIANITAINLLENGNREARDLWQMRQLANLLQHVEGKSAFWRERLPRGKKSAREVLALLPVQSRNDVVAQVLREGSLVRQPDGSSPQTYASTGSTATPVRVHQLPENGFYNLTRSLAQYFQMGLPIHGNRVQINPPASLEKIGGTGLQVIEAENWAGPLGELFVAGTNKKITYAHNNDALLAELSKSPVAFLNCASRFVEMLLEKGGEPLFRKLGVKAWMHASDLRNTEATARLRALGITCHSSYSSAEVGPIAHECPQCPDHFHVTHSNVIVEGDESLSADFDGERLSRLLISHFHSYATPILRYDVGDFGRVRPRCACGHDGTTISHIQGRRKSFLRHPDGRLLPFYISTQALLKIVKFKECRVRQYQVDTITLEFGGRTELDDSVANALTALVKAATDIAFKVEIKCSEELDWSQDAKRLFFSSRHA